MKSLSVAAACLLSTLSYAQDSIPVIRFDASNPIRMPKDMHLGEVTGVAVNSKGHVFVFSRGNTNGPAYGAAAAQLLEFDADGRFVREIGKNLYAWSFGHTVRIDKDDNIWATDKGSDMVIKFNPEGQVVMVFGRKQEASDRETGPLERHKPPLPPEIGRFRQVTDVTWDAAGNGYISDGYINSRVAKVDKNGKWLKSFGEPGKAPGQLNTPHSIAADAQGNIYVADRGNRRIQVFDGEEAALRIQLSGEINLQGGGSGGQFIHSGKWKTAFRLVSKLVAPEVVIRDQKQPFEPPYSHDSAHVNHYDGSDKLEVNFLEKIEDDGGKRPTFTWATDKILRSTNDYSLVIPGENPKLISNEFAHLINPFFFQDRHHTFYVEPTLTEKTFVEWEDWVVKTPAPQIDVDDIVLASKVPEWIDPAGPVEFDPLSMFEIEETSDWATAQQTLLGFDDAWVGRTGGVNVQTLPAMDKTVIDTIANIDNNSMHMMIGAGGLNPVAVNSAKQKI